jgi:hypothetical protein
MKVIAAIVALLVVGWGAGTFSVAFSDKAADDARRAQEAAIAALGEKVADELAALQGSSLKEACANRLPKGLAESVVGYSLKLGEGERPSMRGSAKRVDAVIVRMNDHHEYLERTELDPPRPEARLNFTASMSPDDWSRLMGYTELSRQRTAAVKLVILTSFSRLRSPAVLGDTFSPGAGEYRSRVVAWPSGKTLCEGTGTAHLKLPKVTGHGGSLGDAAFDSERKLSDDWAEATIASPLDDVCELVGRSSAGRRTWRSSRSTIERSRLGGS